MERQLNRLVQFGHGKLLLNPTRRWLRCSERDRTTALATPSDWPSWKNWFFMLRGTSLPTAPGPRLSWSRSAAMEALSEAIGVKWADATANRKHLAIAIRQKLDKAGAPLCPKDLIGREGAPALRPLFDAMNPQSKAMWARRLLARGVGHHNAAAIGGVTGRAERRRNRHDADAPETAQPAMRAKPLRTV
jgi:hypothetical protein